jgi:CheY-like chemotaxis protein
VDARPGDDRVKLLSNLRAGCRIAARGSRCMNEVNASELPVLLYVDDNVDDLHLMQMAAGEGRVSFRLQMVNGFYQAVDYLLDQGAYADCARFPRASLVLLDNELAGYKGADLLRWIRMQGPIASISVVIFSGQKELHEMAECYAAGADYYLTKPGTFDDLVKVARCLDECLRHSPPQLETLRKVAVRPELARQALKMELREGLAEHRKLIQEHRGLMRKIDAIRAEQKERKKQIPFIPNRGRTTEDPEG